MGRSTFIERVAVVASLRSRDLHGRADWVDRELPAFIDTSKHAALLRTLDIDAAALSPQVLPDRDIEPEHSLH